MQTINKENLKKLYDLIMDPHNKRTTIVFKTKPVQYNLRIISRGFLENVVDSYYNIMIKGTDIFITSHCSCAYAKITYDGSELKFLFSIADLGFGIVDPEDEANNYIDIENIEDEIIKVDDYPGGIRSKEWVIDRSNKYISHLIDLIEDGSIVSLDEFCKEVDEKYRRREFTASSYIPYIDYRDKNFDTAIDKAALIKLFIMVMKDHDGDAVYEIDGERVLFNTKFFRNAHMNFSNTETLSRLEINTYCYNTGHVDIIFKTPKEEGKKYIHFKLMRDKSTKDISAAIATKAFYDCSTKLVDLIPENGDESILSTILDPKYAEYIDPESLPDSDENKKLYITCLNRIVNRITEMMEDLNGYFVYKTIKKEVNKDET